MRARRSVSALGMAAAVALTGAVIAAPAAGAAPAGYALVHQHDFGGGSVVKVWRNDANGWMHADLTNSWNADLLSLYDCDGNLRQHTRNYDQGNGITISTGGTPGPVKVRAAHGQAWHQPGTCIR